MSSRSLPTHAPACYTQLGRTLSAATSPGLPPSGITLIFQQKVYLKPLSIGLSFHNPLACVTGSYIIEAALSQALSTRIDVTRLGWSSGFNISIGTLKSLSLNDPTLAKMLRIKENDGTLMCKDICALIKVIVNRVIL